MSGRGAFILDGRPHDLRPGTVWYYPPGTTHDYYPLCTFHYCWLTLSGPGCGELFAMLGIAPGLNPAGLCPLHLFRSVRSDLEAESVEKRMKALADAFKILTMVEASRAAERVNPSLAGAEEYIDGNCGNAALTVSSLADLYGMDRSSFSRAFRRRCGCSVKQYITDCRLKKAAGLLTGTDLSLARISSECGMRSAHYFSKVFSARMGMSPAVFRRRNRASAGAACGKLAAESR
ncbi:MAG: AraC family transcriptional regulator [Lentisphaeria bacterium]|nr:AraC family transcriptional regulator [Lentisphaeria bacterium]